MADVWTSRRLATVRCGAGQKRAAAGGAGPQVGDGHRLGLEAAGRVVLLERRGRAPPNASRVAAGSRVVSMSAPSVSSATPTMPVMLTPRSASAVATRASDAGSIVELDREPDRHVAPPGPDGTRPARRPGPARCGLGRAATLCAMPAPLGKTATKRMPDIQVFGTEDSQATRAAIRFFKERRVVVELRRPPQAGRWRPASCAASSSGSVPGRCSTRRRAPTATAASATCRWTTRDRGPARSPTRPLLRWPLGPPRQRGHRRPGRGRRGRGWLRPSRRRALSPSTMRRR